MIVPIQDIQGLVYNEYIHQFRQCFKNPQKLGWYIDIISKLPEARKSFLLEKQKDFDPLISLKKICKNKPTVDNVLYLP